MPTSASAIQSLIYGSAFPGLQQAKQPVPPPPIPPPGQAHPLTPPSPGASDRVVIYAPVQNARTGRWTGRAVLHTRHGETIELAATGSDALYQAARGLVNNVAQWIQQHYEYVPAQRRASFDGSGFGHIPGTAGRFGQRASNLQLGEQPGIAFDDDEGPGRGLFSVLPVVAGQLARAPVAPADDDVTAAAETARRARAGDPGAVAAVGMIYEQAAGGDAAARDAVETLEIVDLAITRPEAIDVGRVMTDAAGGNDCARKHLAALREVAERCPTRIEWQCEDYAGRSDEELVADVLCAVTDHIEARCVSPCLRRSAGRSAPLRRVQAQGPGAPEPRTLAQGAARFGCANFGQTVQVRPSYTRPMLESYYAMLGGALSA